MLRALGLSVLLCLAAPALAQDEAPAASPAPETARIVLATQAGDIVIEVETERAPVTSANFLRYIDDGRLDDTEFYRAMKIGEEEGLVQGGVRDPRRLFPPIAHEPTTQTGLSHTDGAISLARTTPGTAAADFFIILGDRMVGLDAGPNAGGDLLGFAAFGRVVEGMDVVRRILDSPTSPTEGEGVMRGQMLEPRIRIVTARRAE
ncbi:MAG: peptidylprolyl isomerase [Sphingomonas sp.]|nr:peptidylprolyl isomerase [Sphingomonas sp.]